MNTYSFTKENGTWYINFRHDLKEFNKSDFTLLEESAPLLDFLSNEKKKVTLAIETCPFDKAIKLELIQMCDGDEEGAYYQLTDARGKVLDEKVWLSDFLFFVFGDIPEIIYLRREKSLTVQPMA